MGFAFVNGGVGGGVEIAVSGTLPLPVTQRFEMQSCQDPLLFALSLDLIGWLKRKPSNVLKEMSKS